MADKLLSMITTRIIAVSQAVRSFASHQAYIPNDKFEIIPNCIPLHQIRILSSKEQQDKKRELGIDDTQPVIITVGRLSIEKGHLFLLDAATKVIQKKPNVVFIIVGDGPCKSSLLRQAEHNGLGNQIQFMGFRQDIYELLQISTILSLPSLREGLPVTLLEASACFLPIVASNVGGVPEVVEDGINGLLTPPGDDVALAKAILFLLNSPNLRYQMGQEGHKIVEGSYSAEVISVKMISLYKRLWSEYAIRAVNNRVIFDR